MSVPKIPCGLSRQALQSAYGDKYDPLMMYDSKRDAKNLLYEEDEPRSVREYLRQEQQKQNKKNSRGAWKR